MKTKQAIAFCFLVGLGSLQMAGDVFGAPRLKALGAALQLAPAMKVFTAHQGYETHAARFTLSWRDEFGTAHRLRFEPGARTAIRGPYNRRNVYGAALAYGPLLRDDPRTLAMQESVMRYAFCDPGALRGELGLARTAHDLRIEVTPRRPDARRDLPLAWEVACRD